MPRIFASWDVHYSIWWQSQITGKWLLNNAGVDQIAKYIVSQMLPHNYKIILFQTGIPRVFPMSFSLTLWRMAWRIWARRNLAWAPNLKMKLWLSANESQGNRLQFATTKLRGRREDSNYLLPMGRIRNSCTSFSSYSNTLSNQNYIPSAQPCKW